MKFSAVVTFVVACAATLISAAPAPGPAAVEAREASPDPQCLRRFCA
ncbi:hypothetical protein CC1G_15662 [Coprinopsis cinerea okayama7|uniref:Uncharacterized protein n=1 Tax=Coprinopsis cinerea (strain Okayama-7 / 130 / ATCC MYA-4618 / FGSC 9003) TaxID=240176 RepID=D6RQC2_COPC7|nr:hypothetical protein CC1G_15662 [Coprinopsis cinerea okayama7\|eukprot:XP_002910232.1 hypothetical protein CC1G_15662 [Coprinopsis cinerea okayama7\